MERKINRWYNKRKMKKKFLATIFIFILLVAGTSLFLYLKACRKHPPPEKTSSATIGKGGTLLTSLAREGFSQEEIFLLQEALRPIFDFRKCYPDDKYEITRTSGKLKNIRYWTSPLDFYLVERGDSGELVASRERVKTEEVITGIKGEIESSLYESMLKENLTPDLIMRFADIFAWQIDFLTEPRTGDVFKLIWKNYQKDGKSLLEGRILAAQYENNGKIHTAVFFEDSAGSGDHYTLEGESLRKMFLRSPLNYRRISSYFSYQRFHPILKYYRPHLGIDYAAPSGTPVSTIGDGMVVYAGWKDGFGRFVKIRHSGSYYTTYGHLSRYGRGIKEGKKVKQGQVIGYVGTSGLSTGPHLDFRIIRNGRFVNFLKIKLPSAKSLDPKYMASFNEIKDQYLSRLNQLDFQGNLAVTDSLGVVKQ